MMLESEKICEEYEVCLNSGDVWDNIPYGETDYPVVKYCSLGKYAAALQLCAKGYLCMHEGEEAGEFWKICCSFVKYRKGVSRDEEFLQEMMSHVLREYEKLGLKKRMELIEGFDLSLLNKKLTTVLRQDFPLVYQDLLRKDIDAVALVRCSDVGFLKDYMGRLVAQERVRAYSLRCKLKQNLPEILLEGAMKLVSKNGLYDYTACLRQLLSYCEEGFPKGYLCDIAVVEAVMKLRLVVAEAERCSGEEQLDEKIYDSQEGKKVYAKLNDLLYQHMPMEYMMDRLVRALIVSCQVPCDDFTPGGKVNTLQKGDYRILQLIFDYGYDMFEDVAFLVSEDNLSCASRLWREKQIEERADQIFTTYEDTKERVEEFVEWVRAHCQVI